MVAEQAHWAPQAYAASVEGEARLLLLIDAFSQREGTLEGRTKLAKLDFLLRYPAFFQRAMAIKGIQFDDELVDAGQTIDDRMVRFRYGPWDPAYYALLGSLLGRRLIEAVPRERYIGFRTTEMGQRLAADLSTTHPWRDVAARARLLRRAFRTQGGTYLKNFVYDHFPEVAQASWGDSL